MPEAPWPRYVLIKSDPILIQPGDVAQEWHATRSKVVGYNLGPGNPRVTQRVEQCLLLLRDGRWLRTSQEEGESLVRGEWLTREQAIACLLRAGRELPPQFLAPGAPPDVAPAGAAEADASEPARPPADPSAGREEASRQGPIPPDRFLWEGKLAKGLTGHQWRLLEALCENGHLREAVPVAQVICHVYGIEAKAERAIEGKNRALQELRRRTQDALDEVPLMIEQSNKHLHLTPIPPKKQT